MGRPDLSVKVLNISPKVTVEELCTFFSFCGTVDDIKLHRAGDKDQPYSATVTFKQPYAFQTALLLDDALLVDRRVRVLSVVENQSGHVIPITPSQSPGKNNTNQAHGVEFADPKSDMGRKPGAPQQQQQPSSVTQVMVKKGHEVLNYAREVDDKYKVRESGRELVKQTRSAAEHAAGRVGTAIAHSSCFSKSTLWLAGVLDRASKYAAELGNLKLKDGISANSRKKK